MNQHPEGLFELAVMIDVSKLSCWSWSLRMILVMPRKLYTVGIINFEEREGSLEKTTIVLLKIKYSIRKKKNIVLTLTRCISCQEVSVIWQVYESWFYVTYRCVTHFMDKSILHWTFCPYHLNGLLPPSLVCGEAVYQWEDNLVLLLVFSQSSWPMATLKYVPSCGEHEC